MEFEMFPIADFEEIEPDALATTSNSNSRLKQGFTPVLHRRMQAMQNT
jgi:hypothetical protein